MDNCLLVPTHTSFLEILTLSGFLNKPIKYVSKDSILKIPLIGWPMRLAGHIALKTDSRRSQLETFKDARAVSLEVLFVGKNGKYYMYLNIESSRIRRSVRKH